MSSLKVQTLKGYIGAGLNIAVTGIHGVGKTAKLNEACAQLGYKVKYYNAPTLDVYTDILGIPVPNTTDKTVEYYRPKDVDDADVIFVDEINRADPKTLNAIMEMVLSHSINGEPLPKLKCVVAAMNPVSDDYATDELDFSILDRFDIFLQADPEIDLGYFVKRFGDDVGAAAVKFWKGHHQSYTDAQTRSASGNAVAYISPRRMEKITAAFMAIPVKETIVDCLPPEVLDSKAVSSNIFRTLDAARRQVKTQAATNGIRAEILEITNSSIQVQRSAETGRRVTTLVEEGNLSDDEKNRLLTSLSIALSSGKSPAVLMKSFGPAVRAMNATQLKILMRDWSASDQSALQRLM